MTLRRRALNPLGADLILGDDERLVAGVQDAERALTVVAPLRREDDDVPDRPQHAAQPGDPELAGRPLPDAEPARPADAVDEVVAAMAPSHAEVSAREAKRQAKQQERMAALERKQLEKAARAARGPGAWRRWVLPSLKLLVAAAIAIALVKLAFFPTQEADAAAEIVPGAAFDEPVAVVERGSVENSVTLNGTVVPVEAVPIRSTQSGTVARVLVDDGVEVAEGAPLFTVRVESEPEPNDEGEVGEPDVAVYTMRAPATGTLTDFELLPGQPAELGGDVGAIQPAQYRIEAPVGATDQYRLTTQPESAEVTIDSGPAPFTCTELTIRQPTGEEATSGATATLSCLVPSDVRVFVGLSAKLELDAGTASDVLLLPTTAVLGSADSGLVYVPTTGPDGLPGEPTEVRVELGLSDGTMVEVRSGLGEGDSVLQFVPGAVDPCADPATADPAVCGGLGFEVFP